MIRESKPSGRLGARRLNRIAVYASLLPSCRARSLVRGDSS